MSTHKKGKENIMNDLKLIKKYYGEEMMHLCRELFPTILEKEGLLFNTLSSKFHPYKYIVEDLTKYPHRNDIEIFKDTILFAIDSKKSKESLPKTDKTVKELFDEAGYILYECYSEEDIQKFKKYYAPGEELCTFNGDRLNTHHVFFAVKKNIDEIKRENFNNPSRQDEYGTSIISIQFSRGDSNNLSIKNRYNHTVSNPDATFSNNLENIIEGLTYAFEKEYNLHITQNQFLKEELQDYVLADDGKYYRYNYENNNIYYCPDNIIINNFKVDKRFIDKEKYLLIDYFIINLQNENVTDFIPPKILYHKSINLYDSKISDCFSNYLYLFDKININKTERNSKVLELIKKNQEPVYIEIDKYNNIIGYTNSNLKCIGDGFLIYNRSLKSLKLDNVDEIRNYFMGRNKKLSYLSLPSVVYIGDNFLSSNKKIKTIKLDKVETVKRNFLCGAKELRYFYAPNLEKVDDYFLQFNDKLTSLSLEKLVSVENNFMQYNNNLEYFWAPNLEKVGYRFLEYNKKLKTIDFPKLKELSDEFLDSNVECEEINLPCVKKIRGNCLSNVNCKEISLPQVEYIGQNFLCKNRLTEKIYLPRVKEIEHSFMSNNVCLKEISLPQVKTIFSSFLNNNQIIERIDIPKCRLIYNSFLCFNESLKYFYAPSLEEVGTNFLYFNKNLLYLYAPNLKVVDENFLTANESLNHLYLPSLEEAGIYFLDQNKNTNQLYLPSYKHAPFFIKQKVKSLKELNRQGVYLLGDKNL